MVSRVVLSLSGIGVLAELPLLLLLVVLYISLFLLIMLITLLFPLFIIHISFVLNVLYGRNFLVSPPPIFLGLPLEILTPSLLDLNIKMVRMLIILVKLDFSLTSLIIITCWILTFPALHSLGVIISLV